MPKLKLGAAIYAVIAIGLGSSAVLILLHFGSYSEVDGWSVTATAIVVGLTGVMFAVGAVTRRGLVADEGPWICRHGWLVVVGLTVASIVISFVAHQDSAPVWPTGPVLFVPHWIRRMQESYYQGVDDAEREIAVVRAAERAGEIPPRPRTTRWFGR